MAKSDLHVTIKLDPAPLIEALERARRDLYRSKVLHRYTRLLLAAVERGELSPTDGRIRYRKAVVRLMDR